MNRIRNVLSIIGARFVRALITFVLKHYRLCDEHKAALLKVQFLCSASCVFGIKQSDLSTALKRVLDNARRDMRSASRIAEEEARWLLQR